MEKVNNKTEEKAIASEIETSVRYFEGWNDQIQLEVVQNHISRMSHSQHVEINSLLKVYLQRDFIGLFSQRGLDHLMETILLNLDFEDLCSAELVNRNWHSAILELMIWKKKLEKNVRTMSVWKKIGEKRDWIQFLFKRTPEEQHPNQKFYKTLFSQAVKDIETLESNWVMGRYSVKLINCQTNFNSVVYCLQFDDHKIVSGLGDDMIKIWDRNTLDCVKVLRGHTSGVLCLQYDDRMIISGSLDGTIRVWDVNSGELVNTLSNHNDGVLHMRFNNEMMVTSSMDCSLAIWRIESPTEMTVQRVIVNNSTVCVLEFDEEYIVSGHIDSRIKVWNTSTCDFVRTLNGHTMAVVSMDYKFKLLASGSNDWTIRLWDIETGSCLRVLEGHDNGVRCIKLNKSIIISGGLDCNIKIWDLNRALNSKCPSGTLCLQTYAEHTGPVYGLQFDEFNIISCSQDNTILIRDFLDS